jgi:hypothetical protein
MAKYTYIYQGGDADYWDAKGKTTVSSTASQKDLEYLYSINYDGVVRQEVAEEKAKK